MSLFKRNKTWWIDFTTPSGKRVKHSAKTTVKREAQEYHDKLKQDLWKQNQLGVISDKTWDDAAFKWVQAKEDEANYGRNLQKLNWFQPYFGNRLLADIDRALIEEVIGLKYEETSGANANRYIAVVSAVLTQAVKWEWLTRKPYIERYKEDKKRIRWLKKEEYLSLLTVLPDYLKPMVQFSVATGLRQSNVKLLTWEQIDLKRAIAWIHPDQSKSGEPIGVPFNKEALNAVKGQLNKDPVYVFVKNGLPIMDPNNRDWRKALAKAEIENFRWHDLRHTWASWHVQNGTPLYVLKELGGWKTLAMVEKYAHLAPEHLVQYVENVRVQENEHGTNTEQAA